MRKYCQAGYQYRDYIYIQIDTNVYAHVRTEHMNGACMYIYMGEIYDIINDKRTQVYTELTWQETESSSAPDAL